MIQVEVIIRAKGTGRAQALTNLQKYERERRPGFEEIHKNTRKKIYQKIPKSSQVQLNQSKPIHPIVI